MFRRVQVGMSAEEVIAVLGPPTDQSHPGLSLGHHFYYWSASDDTLEVSCDLAGIVYDYGKKAPQEMRRDGFQGRGEDASRRWLSAVPDLRDE